VTSQEASHDPCTIEKNTSTVGNSPKNTNSYLSDIPSQLSDFTDDIEQSNIANQPISSENCLNCSDVLDQSASLCDTTTRSHDLDCDTSCDLDHDVSLDPDCNTSHDLDHDHDQSTSEVETSCDQNNTHLEDSVVIEDIEDKSNCVEEIKEFQYNFVSSNFTVKVCMQY